MAIGRKAETEISRDRRHETDRNRQRQTETTGDKQRQAETDRDGTDRERQTEIGKTDTETAETIQREKAVSLYSSLPSERVA